MRRILYAASITLLLAGCEASTDPLDGIGGGPPGGGAITQLQASGDWTLTLRRTTELSCTGGSMPDNQVIFMHLDVISNGTLTTSTSTWRASPSATVRALDGVVTFSSGLTRLNMYASATNTTNAMELNGTLTSTGNFTGTVSDPRAGSLPVFSGNGCRYTATGVKTG